MEYGKVTLDLIQMMMRRQTITGSTLRARSVADKAAIARSVEREGLAADRGRHSAAGHRPNLSARRGGGGAWLIESSRHVGKILLIVG